MKRLLQVLLVCIIPVISFAQTALIEIPFTFSDGVATQEMIVGLDLSATNGVDLALGESYVPPNPPIGAFDTRFDLPVLPIDQSLKDIRYGDNTAASIGDIIHTVRYQLGAGSALQISWNLPFGVELNIQDNFGGGLFNENFLTGPGNYTLPVNVGVFKLTAKYIDPPFPVELTSFNGMVLNETVRLNWETATEINNYGFDIERKTEGNWQKLGFVQGNGNSNSPKGYSFVDKNLLGGSKFMYRLKQIDNDGQFEYSDVVEVEVVPAEFSLYQNFPNPFNPSTKIRYQLPNESKVVIKIYNLLGSEIMELLNEKKEAGIYEVEFNADNLSSGTYLYKIIADKFVQTKKMILLK